MEDMLWIEDIVESTPTPPFLTKSRVGMANFVNLHKVVATVHSLPFQVHEMEVKTKNLKTSRLKKKTKD